MAAIRESSVGASTKPLRVDRVRGIIYGAKVLGERGNCDYPRATREAAIPLLEGKRVFVDHGPLPSRGAPARERSYRDALGYHEGVHEGGDGLYSREFHFNPRHELAEQLCWDAENAPHLLGFSIVGDADKRREGSRYVVEAITRLDSCDLVTTPAHGGGIFEAARSPMKQKLSEIVEALKDSRPHYVRGLAQVREAMDGAESGAVSDPMMDAPADAPDEAADHEQAMTDGFRAAWCALFDDDSMDSGAKIAKGKELLKAMDKLMGKGGEPSEPAEAPAAEEARKKKAGNLRESALLALGRKGVKLTPLVETAIKGCETEADVKALVESLGDDKRPGARSVAPAAGAAVRESKTAPAKTPAEMEAERQARLQKMRSTR